MKNYEEFYFLENIEQIQIDHYKYWNLASATVLPVYCFLSSMPTTDVGQIWLTGRY